MTGIENYGGQQEVPYSGWQLLADVLRLDDELFRQTFFLEGYVYSSNIYAMTGSYLTIVDPGNDYTAFIELAELGYGPADTQKIVLTHQHQDHTLGIFELLRGYPSIMERGGFEVILHEANPPQLKKMVRQFGSRVTEVKGGETLELSGFEWEVIHTPGHTLDGICLYHAPTKTAFTGDTVMPHAMAKPDPNAGGRLEDYVPGLQRLLGKEVDSVLPGHSIPVASHGQRVIEETLEGVLMKLRETEQRRRNQEP